MSAPLLYYRFPLACGVAVVFAAIVGCQRGESREAQKPVVEDSTTVEFQSSLDDAGEDLSQAADAAADAAGQAADRAGEAASDAADSVTPDDPIVDIRTPLGNVQVGKDPVTGETNVDVNTPKADVDVEGSE